ncbi:hypothetical protein RKD29_003925 [Streptomyces tendae]
MRSEADLSPRAGIPFAPIGLGTDQVPEASMTARAVMRSSAPSAVSTCTVNGCSPRPESTIRSRPARATPVTVAP